MTITSVVEEYLRWLEAAGYARDTVRTRRASLRKFSRWTGEQGVRQLSDLTPLLLERYRRVAALRQHGYPPPLTAGSQVQALLAVKRFCAWCARSRLVATDPASQYTLPRRPEQLPRAVLSAREAEAVLAQPDINSHTGLRDRAILETLYSTGVRRAELIGLSTADVDSERGTLWVRQGKGGRQRVVPIGRRALQWVSRYARDARPRVAGDSERSTLFLTRSGRSLGHHLSDTVHRYVQSADIGKSGGCHLFRHTMATLMLENGADVRFIQAILGHAQLSTTALYTHVSIAALQAVHRRTHPAERVARFAADSDCDADGDGSQCARSRGDRAGGELGRRRGLVDLAAALPAAGPAAGLVREHEGVE